MEHHHHQHLTATSMNDMGMKMYFHFGFGDQFLFEQFTIDSTLKMWSTCIALFLLTLIFEAIKYVRCVHCGCQTNKQLQRCSSDNGGDSSQDNSTNDTNVRLASSSMNRNCYVGRLRSRRHRLIQSILHTIQTAIGFLLMLSVMSFNLCIIFAIIVGTGVGYFIFYRPYNEIEAIDSCH